MKERDYDDLRLDTGRNRIQTPDRGGGSFEYIYRRNQRLNTIDLETYQ